jgi:hypothetical protein
VLKGLGDSLVAEGYREIREEMVFLVHQVLLVKMEHQERMGILDRLDLMAYLVTKAWLVLLALKETLECKVHQEQLD